MPRTLTALALLAAPLLADDPKGPAPVRLIQVSSGKALSVEPPPENEDLGGRAVVVQADPMDPAQEWKIEPAGKAFKLVNRKTGQVLDVSDESTDPGAPIIQWEDNGFDNQRWNWVGDGAERRLRSKSSGLVADTDKDGKLVQRKADKNAKSQLWKVVPVGK